MADHERSSTPKVQVGDCRVYQNLPDGSYRTRIENAEYRLSKAGKPMVVYAFVITEGFFANRHVWKYTTVAEQSGKDRVLKDVRRLGITASSVDEVIKRLLELEGRVADIALKTSMYHGKPSQFVFILGAEGQLEKRKQP